MSLARLSAIRAALDGAPFDSLSGRFHSHLTVSVEPEALEALRAVCRSERVKLTVVDLQGGASEVQRDVMTTRYHLDREPGAVGRIADDLLRLGGRLDGAGFPVVRAKLEHEGAPSLPTYTDARYHEVHIKLAIPELAYPDAYRWLAEHGPTHGFVASRNPNERTADTVLQFVNLRIGSGDRAAADARVDGLLALLQANGFDVREVKRETTVFDTHRAHDRWWA